jgi:hypothetical protein
MSDQLPFLGESQLLIAEGGDDSQEIGEESFVSNFRLICQELTNWCWAAVTQSILDSRLSVSTQREVAVAHIKKHRPSEPEVNLAATATQGGVCEDMECKAQFNAPHSLRRLLAERSLLQPNGYIQGSLTFDQLKAEIDQGRPVACRIKWTNTIGAHFVCVAGYAANGSDQFVRVFDPLVPGINGGEASPIEMRFETFLKKYPLGTLVGKLTHAYLT